MDLVVTADKGGVGKSLMAAHLAGRMHHLGRAVTLWDLDRRGSSSRQISRSIPELPTVDLTTDREPETFSVLDTPAHPSDLMRDAMRGSLAVVVTDADIDGVMAACSMYADLAARGVLARVLINNLPPTSGVGMIRQVLDEMQVPYFRTAVRRYACYSHARIERRLVCDYPYAKADEAWSDIKALCEEVLEILDA